MSKRCSLRSAAVSAVLVSLVGGTAVAADPPVPVRQPAPSADTFDFTVPVQVTNVNASKAITFQTVSVFCAVSTGLTTGLEVGARGPTMTFGHESTGAPGRFVASGESPAQPLQNGSFNGSIHFTLTASDKAAAPEAHSYACWLMLDHQAARNMQVHAAGGAGLPGYQAGGVDQFVPATFKPVAQGQIH